MLTKSRHTRRITIMESDKIVRNTQVVDSEWLRVAFYSNVKAMSNKKKQNDTSFYWT